MNGYIGNLVPLKFKIGEATTGNVIMGVRTGITSPGICPLSLISFPGYIPNASAQSERAILKRIFNYFSCSLFHDFLFISLFFGGSQFQSVLDKLFNHYKYDNISSKYEKTVAQKLNSTFCGDAYELW